MNFGHYQSPKLLGSSPPITNKHGVSRELGQTSGDYLIYRQTLGWSAKSKIPDRLGNFRHMKTRLKVWFLKTRKLHLTSSGTAIMAREIGKSSDVFTTIYGSWIFDFFRFLLSSSAADMMIEPEEVPEPMETTFTSDQTAGGEFLSLDELGKVLRQLALQGVIQHSPLENVHLSLIFVIIKMARHVF